MMQLKKIFAAISMLAFVWGGFFCLSPSMAFAYGSGTQSEKFPQTITSASFAQLAQTKLEQELAASGETRRHTVTLSRGVSDMHLPAGKLICEVDVPRAIRYGGLTPVHVSAFVNDKLYRRAILYYRVDVFDTVLVAARDLRPEEKIGAGDVKSMEVAVEAVDTPYLRKPEEILGRVPSRYISMNKPILPEMLQTELVIESNSTVTIRTELNGIVVSAEGVALQRGRIGERIRVRNAKSGKVVMGTVIDAHTVQVGS